MQARYTFLAIIFLTLCSCGNTQKSVEKGSNIVTETILARRSVRSYKNLPVERKKLEEIVKCGIYAPSALNEQPWAIRVVTDSAFFNGSSRLYHSENPTKSGTISSGSIYRNAPVVIFIAAPAGGKGLIDCGMLGENMMIAAQSLGLATVTLTRPIRFLKSSETLRTYINKLNLPVGYELIFGIGVGYPDEEPAVPSRNESKIIFIK